MATCFYCNAVLACPGTPLPCGCASFHNDCYLEYLLLCDTMAVRTLCPCCHERQPLDGDEKETILYLSSTDQRPSGLMLWKKTNDMPFLLTLADRDADTAFRLADRDAKNDRRLAKVFCRKLRSRIPSQYLPPLDVAVETRILTHKLCAEYMRRGEDYLLLPPKYRCRLNTVVAALKRRPSVYASLDADLASRRRVIDTAVRRDGTIVQHVPPALVDLKLALCAVRESKEALALLPDAWRLNRQVQVAACDQHPAAVLSLPKEARGPLARAVLARDGSLVDAFSHLSPDLEELAIETSPAAAVLKLRRRWGYAILRAPASVVRAARLAGVRIPDRCMAYALSRHPNDLWDEAMPTRMKKIAILCGGEPKPTFTAELDAFFVRHSPMKRANAFERPFQSRELARLAARRFGPLNMLKNLRYFSEADVRAACANVDLLPICDESRENALHPLFQDPVLRLQWFGVGAVPEWRKEPAVVDHLICSKACNFNRRTLLKIWKHLTSVEKKSAVHKYPGLLVTVPLEDRPSMALAALTSPTLCRGLVFADGVLRNVMAAIPKQQRRRILEEHPEYSLFVPPFKAPSPPSRIPPPPPPPTKPEHMLRAMRADLEKALLRNPKIAKTFKKHAYALVDASTSRRCLDLLALRFVPITEDDRRLLLRKGRVPSILSGRLRLTPAEMQRLVPQDLRAAAEGCTPTQEALAFFLRKRQYHILRRLAPSQFESVLQHVDALPTLLPACRPSQEAGPQNASSTTRTGK